MYSRTTKNAQKVGGIWLIDFLPHMEGMEANYRELGLRAPDESD